MSEPTSFEVRGVVVDFPYKPYPCQLVYMEKVIKSLQEGKNALLESPTGTGKTLCLLCAALAWRQHLAAHQQLQQLNAMAGQSKSIDVHALQANLQVAAMWDTKNPDGSPKSTGGSGVPKIIYSSRTHSQLAQVIKELKSTAYHPKVTILGSRDQMCVHDEIIKLESSTAKVHGCRQKVAAHSCEFKRNLDHGQDRSEVLGRVETEIMDIEDLAVLGKRRAMCPYYLTREMQTKADIIFLPYNYLIDPVARKSNKVTLDNAIVIFDEAHNLESICEEASSVELTSQEIAGCTSDVDQAIAVASQEGYSGSLSLQDLAILKALMLDIEEKLDEIPLPAPKGPTSEEPDGKVDTGLFVYEFLERVNITKQTKDQLLEVIDNVVTVLNEQKEGQVVLKKQQAVHLSRFVDLIRSVFADELVSRPEDVKRFYRVFVAVDEAAEAYRRTSKRTTGKIDLWTAKARGPGPLKERQLKKLCLWCFSPGFALRDMMKQGVRSLILTSGTLSPLASFEAELLVGFPITLENPHVIEKRQLCLTVVPSGPTGKVLNSSFKTRDTDDYKNDLGNTIVNFARIIPNGLLVFFPSYSVMNMCIDGWQSSAQANGKSIWERITQFKTPIREPKTKGEFDMAMDEFYSKIKDPNLHGAIFFAVCRGKVSEGLDFADANGRGVIITGQPFPAMQDARVKLKRLFMDEQHRLAQKEKTGIVTLSGNDWYKQQAARAVNQAIGRVIRHRRDYGVIILADERFKSPSSIAQLPYWVRSYVNVCERIGEAFTMVTQFFKIAEADPTLRTDRPALPAPKTTTSSSSSTSTTSNTIQVVAARPLPTDPIHRKEELQRRQDADKRVQEMQGEGLLDDEAAATMRAQHGLPITLEAATLAPAAAVPVSRQQSTRVVHVGRPQETIAVTGARGLVDRLNSAPTGPTRAPPTIISPEEALRAISASTSVPSYSSPLKKPVVAATKPNLFGSCDVDVIAPPSTKAKIVRPPKSPEKPEKASEAEIFLEKAKSVLVKAETRQFKRSLLQYRTDKSIVNLVENLKSVFDHPGRWSLIQEFRHFVKDKQFAEFDRLVVETYVSAKRDVQTADVTVAEDETVKRQRISNDIEAPCIVCKNPCKIPFLGKCRHVACHTCWLSSLKDAHQCPKCGEPMKKCHLLKKYF